MTRDDFVNYLRDNGIPYYEYNVNGLYQVYVYSRKEYEMKKAHPRKNKNLYIPYLRVSHFDGDRWYTRENGVTGYKSVKQIMNIVEKLGAA